MYFWAGPPLKFNTSCNSEGSSPSDAFKKFEELDQLYSSVTIDQNLLSLCAWRIFTIFLSFCFASVMVTPRKVKKYICLPFMIPFFYLSILIIVKLFSL